MTQRDKLKKKKSNISTNARKKQHNEYKKLKKFSGKLMLDATVRTQTKRQKRDPASTAKNTAEIPNDHLL